jgi:ATP-binding cassette, subfamily B, bacterial
LRYATWNRSVNSQTLQTAVLLVLEIVIMYFAIGAWSRGELTIGDFALIQAVIVQLWSVIWNIIGVFKDMSEALADAQEGVDLLNMPYDIVDVPGAKKLKVTEGAVIFDRVQFNYNETREVLKDFSLAVKPREKIALVGPSGAGKSTVVKILLRYYDLTGGKILVDGQDISKVTQESLRASIAMVPQDPLLFHRSLMDNIRYGKRNATDKEVYEAAKKAHCHEFISALSDGYNTFVGERGIKLSGGERQRVAIARAILKNAPILVLDEATSSLDSESEQLIHEALHELMRDKTVIVIAHRLSTIMEMDRIVVVQEGRIVDSGTHQELLKRVGTYKKLWEIQAGGFAG